MEDEKKTAMIERQAATIDALRKANVALRIELEQARARVTKEVQRSKYFEQEAKLIGSELITFRLEHGAPAIDDDDSDTELVAPPPKLKRARRK